MKTPSQAESYARNLAMTSKCWPTIEFNMATVKTGSTYISTYRHDRDFVPNLNRMPTTSPCRRNFHLHSNSRWQSPIPEILISTLSVTMKTPSQAESYARNLAMTSKCWPTTEFNMATVKTGSTYISTYRRDRDFVPNLNHMPTTSRCHWNFHLHSNPRWQSSIPEILISTLSVTMETPFQSWIIYPHPRNYHEILTDDRIQYGDRQNPKYLYLPLP